ncbi:mandelate racemase/muconate lactonizing enzyme family protein [Variovorax sp. Sphag1AA]|uniref:mandelate racemase/muconate lactonizing enzyme family protein n=1 Tax=Variovorax sp. Sphag1AA TaxID=2587027 RepID=UPI0016194437|nr:mandelate racemase/muconate lactonizing enzyme family protein [Variovorax sp. Sphag1AA]
MKPVRLASVEAFAYRVPVKMPIKVAFGTFRDRPFVLVRVTDEDGNVGWGEAWANWPAVGAEHRARLVVDFGERLVGKAFDSPQHLFEQLSRQLEVLVIQTGEVGPIAQAIAGIDIAVWDLVARREGKPLHKLLSSRAVETVPVYVTGINPDEPERFAAARQAEGHRAFKLKTGFGHDIDVRNLRAMRETLGPQAVITCDSNQTHDLQQATAFVRAIEDLKLSWFEEPIRVDAPQSDWEALAAASTTPLAGGENLQGAQFDAAIGAKVLQVIQPDVTKWGGISGNWEVARKTVAAGKRYCPHYFGGGISVLASLQLLAAAGGEGLLEFDCHPNVGREAVVGDLLPVTDGRVPVPQGPGLGAVPDLDALAGYRTWAPKG